MDPLNPYATSLNGAIIVNDRAHSVSPAFKFAPILSQGLTLYFTNLPAVAIVTLVVWMPVEAFHVFMDQYAFDWYGLPPILGMYRLFEDVTGIIATGGVVAIGGAAMRGERISGWSGLKRGMLTWPRMLWTRILHLAVMLPALLALVVPGLFLGVRLLLIDGTTVLGRQSGVASLKRSFRVTEGNFWGLAGLWLVITIAILIAMNVEQRINGQIAYFVPKLVHSFLCATLPLTWWMLVPIRTMVLVAAYFAAEQHFAQSEWEVASLEGAKRG
jgi:hypothetical protein